MSELSKQKNRIKSKPTDYKWDELTRLLNKLGYDEIQGSGSRVKFYNRKKDSLIALHKPHPSSILKQYMVKAIVNTLEEAGFL
jgi:predicted RNA binding protein YcfA (HicA-like mRNA interferase family)